MSSTLAREYAHQLAWRDWETLLTALPPLAGQLVLDLGCGVGDQAALLTGRGARVLGVEVNEELLSVARAKRIEGVDLRLHDLRALPDLDVEADGLWCSFVAAYFTDLPATVAPWLEALRPGGWAAFTEVDDLFGHEPLADRTKAVFAAYAKDALAAGRYDFHMGRKLRGHLERAGLRVTKELSLADRELAFEGAAAPEVLEAWRERLDRLARLRELAGADFQAVRNDLLGCLARDDHRATATVRCVIAAKP